MLGKPHVLCVFDICVEILMQLNVSEHAKLRFFLICFIGLRYYVVLLNEQANMLKLADLTCVDGDVIFSTLKVST
jgi:hypothetical protein